MRAFFGCFLAYFHRQILGGRGKPLSLRYRFAIHPLANKGRNPRRLLLLLALKSPVYSRVHISSITVGGKGDLCRHSTTVFSLMSGGVNCEPLGEQERVHPLLSPLRGSIFGVFFSGYLLLFFFLFLYSSLLPPE